MCVPMLAMLLTSSPAHAQQAFGAMGASLNKALCTFIGPNSQIVAFIAGVAVVSFFVVLAVNEGNQMVTWGMKILIGVAGLIGTSSVLSMLFPGLSLGC
jgi:hypothetical protein